MPTTRPTTAPPARRAGGSSRIENFIGFPAGLSGADLATRGVLQMLKFGARIVAPVLVEKVRPARSADEWHVLRLDCGAEIRCRVLLLALGVRWRRLDAAGADRFAGAGIYYACTTVEADLYDQADVAVLTHQAARARAHFRRTDAGGIVDEQRRISRGRLSAACRPHRLWFLLSRRK